MNNYSCTIYGLLLLMSCCRLVFLKTSHCASKCPNILCIAFLYSAFYKGGPPSLFLELRYLTLHIKEISSPCYYTGNFYTTSAGLAVPNRCTVLQNTVSILLDTSGITLALRFKSKQHHLPRSDFLCSLKMRGDTTLLEAVEMMIFPDCYCSI